MTTHTLKKFTDEDIKNLDQFVKQQYAARGIDRFSDEIAAADANIANLVPSILIVPDHIKISRQKQDLPLKPGPAPRPKVTVLPVAATPDNGQQERPAERIKKRPAKRRRGRPTLEELKLRQTEMLEARKDNTGFSSLPGQIEEKKVFLASRNVVFSFCPGMDEGIIFVIAMEQLIRDFKELGITTIARGLHYVSNRVGDGTLLKDRG